MYWLKVYGATAVLLFLLSSVSVETACSVERKTQTVRNQGTIHYSGVMMITWYYLMWPTLPFRPSADWDDNYLKDKPLLGEYSAPNSSVLETHIDWAKSAGLDAFAVSVDNKEPILMEFAKMAEERDFKLCFLGEFAWHNMSFIEDHIRWLVSTFSNSPACNWEDGKIMILCWDNVPHEHTFEEWCTLLSKLRVDGVDADFLWLAKSENEDQVHIILDVFDGLFTTGIYSEYDFEQIPKLGSYVHSYPEPKIWCPGILPGYDETLVPGAYGVVIPRSEKYYNDTFSCALESKPDFISIITWNDFWENTYIEPSQNYGYLYLNLTGELSNRAKQNPR